MLQESREIEELRMEICKYEDMIITIEKKLTDQLILARQRGIEFQHYLARIQAIQSDNN